jgi:RND superfamily putative drug exporter
MLFKLGRFSARCRIAVVVVWLAALAAAGGAYALAGGTLASSFDIPGTETAAVSEELAKQVPELAGVAGKVVFRTGDGQPFSDSQRAGISAALEPVHGVDQVRSVVDPFAAEAERALAVEQAADGRRQLAGAREELEAGAAQLEAGAAQLDAGQEQLDAAQAQLDAALAAAAVSPGGPVPDPAQAARLAAELEAQQQQLDVQQEALDAQRAELQSQAAQLEGGRAALDAQEPALDQAEQLIDGAAEIRTVAADGSTAVASVLFADDQFNLPQASKDRVMELIAEALPEGVGVDFSAEIAQSVSGLIGPSEVIGVGVAAIVLAVLLRTILGVVAPIVSSLIGAGIGVAGSMALSGVVDMSSVTPVFGVMLGLAVGIDYSLFIIQRHRRQLRAGMPVTDSIAMATGTAGNAVVFAGSTVAIALAALNVCGIPFLGVMGWIGAACVVIAVAAAITFTPALLALIGQRLLPRSQRSQGAVAQEDAPSRPVPSGAEAPNEGLPSGLSSGNQLAGTPGPENAARPAALGSPGDPDQAKRAPAESGVPSGAGQTGGLAQEGGDGIGGDGAKNHRAPHWRAAASVAAGVLVLGVFAIPALSLRLGLPDGSSEPVESDSHRAFAAVADEFGPGMNGPLVVPAQAAGTVEPDARLAWQAAVASQLMEQPDVVAVAPAGASAAGDYQAFQVIPAEGPASASTEDLVNRLRELSPLADGTELGVAGQASGNIDISAKLADALPFYLLVAVGLSLVIMVWVFRSLLVPLIAAAGFVLSYLAAMGAVVAVYQWGWLGPVFAVHSPGPVLNFMPLVLAGVVFGLAMDYTLFLASGMREAYVHGMPARQAVTAGLRGARTVVTAAALIMVAVFGGFVFSHLALVRPVGFGLAVGVMFDAFVVRLVIVPALMHLAGPAAWWLPRWLDRILPDVDVEGAGLERAA